MSASCLLLMFLTGVFPILAMALPLYAGILIYVVLDEVGISWAFLTYLAVSVLSFFITPNKESSIYFAVFFGSYPIIKVLFEKIHSKVFEIAGKLLAFNVTVISAAAIAVYLFGLDEFLEDFDFLGQFLVPGLIIFANILFLLYDKTLSLVLTSYVKWFKPTFLKKF